MPIRKDGKLRQDPTHPEKVETSPEGERLAREIPIPEPAPSTERPRKDTLA